MNQSYFTDVFTNAKELFPGSKAVRKYSFKAMRLGDSYAIWAVICPILAAFFGFSRVGPALFRKRDCFECLSPHSIAV